MRDTSTDDTRKHPSLEFLSKHYECYTKRKPPLQNVLDKSYFLQKEKSNVSNFVANVLIYTPVEERRSGRKII